MCGFPFLFGRAFIEAIPNGWEQDVVWAFPFLFGRAFIEAYLWAGGAGTWWGRFPFLLGGAFIEAITLLLRWKT